MVLPRVLSVIPVLVCALALPSAATAQTGSISGTVAFEGTAPGPVRVEAHDPYQGDASWGALGWADSNVGGAFSITGLAPGKYRVYFNPSSPDHAFQWYPNKAVASEAQLVTVTDGADTPLGAVTLGRGHTIEGSVTYSGTPPDPGQIWINAQEASTGEWVSWGQADASGHYARTNLPAGKYLLWAWTNSSGYVHEVWPGSIYSSGATPIAVSASGPTASADFTLEEGRTISGRVTLGTTPLQVKGVNASLQGPCCFDVWSNGADANGDYEIRGLPSGTYRLQVQGGFGPDNQPYAGQRWDNRSPFDSGDDVVVGTADVGDKDFSLQEAYTIEGLIYLDANGNDVKDIGERFRPNVQVTVSRASGGCCEWSSSDENGHYWIPLPTGDYKLQANPSAALMREWWHDAAFWEDASAVTVASTNVTGIDFGLREGASVGTGIEGRVVAADGTTGISGVDVQLNRWSTGSGVASVRTGPDGSFRFVSVPAGDYRVYFNTGNSNGVNDQDYVSEYWTKCQIAPPGCPEGVIDPSVQKVSYPEVPYPTPTSLGNFKLQEGGSISGTLCVGSEGTACAPNDPQLPPGFWINLESVVSMGPLWQGPPSVQAGADGRYRIRGVPGPAAYRVRASMWATDFISVYYVSAYSSTPFSNLATPVQVDIGGHQQGKDLHLTQGGSISGHVYCGTSEPIPGMRVIADINELGMSYFAQADEGGNYLVRGLPPAVYHVRTDGRNQGSVSCPNAANETYPSTIPISGTSLVPNVDFHLADGVTISGKVDYLVGGLLKPVVNMRVSANDYETGQYVSDTQTDSAGHYTIYGLSAARSFRVQVRTRDNSLDPQFWNFIEEAYPNDYARWGSRVAGPADGIDFVLELGGAISGRVTAVGGSPLTGVNVHASDLDGRGFWNNDQTDQNGFYIIRGLPAARYSVNASAQPRNYVPEYYDNVVGGQPPTPVTVTPVLDTIPITGNIDFELAPGGIVQGVVYEDKDGGGSLDAGDTRLPNVSVCVDQFAPPGTFLTCANTQGDGTYRFVAPVGVGLRLRINSPSVANLVPVYYDGAANGDRGTEYRDLAVPVAVPAPGASVSDVNFGLVAGGAIEGVVYEDKDGSGTLTAGDVGVSNVNICLNQFAPPNSFLNCVNSRSNGTYRLALPAGVTLRVRANTPQGTNLISVYYDGATNGDRGAVNSNEAAPVTVLNPGETVPISFALSRGGSIAGTVTEEGTGLPLSVTVWLWDESGTSVGWQTTNASGQYSASVAPGQYRVVAGYNAPNHVSESYDNIQFTGWPGGLTGTPVTVTADATRQVDIQLARAGRIRGTVRDAATTQTLSGQQVCIWHGWGFTCGTTGQDGVYTINSLPEGQYIVFVSGKFGYGTLYHDGAAGIPSYGGVPQGAGKVAVTAGNTSDGIDFALHTGARIAGMVMEEGSTTPLANVTVKVYSEFGQMLIRGTTDASGHYLLGGLAAGTYYLRTDNSSGYANECYGGTTCPVVYVDTYESAGSPDFIAGTPVGLAANGLASGVDFTLAKGGRIAGHITNERSLAINGGVSVFDASHRRVATASVSQGWYTTAQGLPAGSYYVFASAPEYVAEVYDDVTCLGCDPANGTPVEVIFGQTTPDIDFVLARGGRIAGRITDAGTGKGLPANVEVWSVSGVRLNPDNAGGGDFTGGYVTNGLPAGTYFLKTDNWSGYVDKAYGNVVCTKACIPVGTEAVQVTEGALTWNINFSLDRGAFVTGTVTNAAGEPMGGTQGQIYDETGRFVTHWGSDPQGRYLPFNSLAPGTYYARTRNLSGYLDEVYNGRPCLADCDLGDGTPIVVGETNIGGVDFVLRPRPGDPRLDSVTPPTGPVLGDNTVVLVGANFSTLAQVRFGTRPALTVLVDSDFRIRAQAPPGAGAGAVDVTVENPGGLSAKLPLAYTYVADTEPPVFTTPLYVASQTLTGPPSNQRVTAILRWTTDEEATTRIDFGIGSLSQSVTVPGYGKGHTVELTGLTPGQTYLFQAVSQDVSGNGAVNPEPPKPPLSERLMTVPDTTPPHISDLAHTVTDTTAFITWRTDEAATSLVEFHIDAAGNPPWSQRATPGFSFPGHSVTIANLQPNRTYVYRVLSRDQSGNESAPLTGGPFTTACDVIPPQLESGPAVSYLSDNLVIIAWTTDELSTSFVNYGVSSVNEQGVMDVSLVRQHVVFLTNLLPGQTYRFQAGSTDACDNTAVTANPFLSGQSVVLGQQRLAQSLRLGVATLAAGTSLATTAATTGFTTPSAADTTGPVVTAPVVTVLGSDRVRITVVSDEAASILARYGVAGVSEASAFDPGFSQTPSLFLAGLSADTTYHLDLVLTDPKGNPTPVHGLTFHTLAQPDTAVPAITNLIVGSITETNATVSWTTNEPAESWVRFGLPGALSNTSSGAGLQASHAIPLAGLAPGTKYAFEASSRDASGNTGTASSVFQTVHVAPTIASLTPARAAQGATVNVVVSGAHFAANTQVGLGDGVVVSISAINPAGTQLVLSVAVGGSASLGQRQLTLTNPTSGLSATASFTVVDTTAPVITVTSPASGAEFVMPSVTITGTVSENADITINGEPVTLSNLAFQKTLTLPDTGAHRVNVTAVDPSGNRASTSIDVKYMTLTVDDAVVSEGNAGSPQMLFNLRLPTTSAQAITVQYATAPGSATPGTDYVGGSGSTTIPAGSLSVPVAIAVSGDLVDEDDETFTLTLTSASGAAIVDGVATGTITDDDRPPTISIDDVAVTEGSSGVVPATFTLTLSHPSSKTVGVSYATGGGTATGGTDYTIANGILSFGPLETTKALTVQVKGDLVDEPDQETFFVNLSAPLNATLGDGQGQVTILDDDVGVSLSVNDASVTEGNSGTQNAVFTVSLSGPSAVKVKVNYATVHVTTTNQDLDPTSGQLVFQPGQMAKTVAVPVKGDTLDEDNETFFVRLTSAQGAPISDGEGVSTILDDDPSPSLRVSDVTVTEGNAGTANATFVVSLSAKSGRSVTVGYATADGGAIAGSDYVAATGLLTFAPGETSKSVNVAVKGDKVKESIETFFLNLTNPLNATLADAQGVGTIKDND